MVPWTIHQPLLLLPFFCARDACILYLRLSGIIPPALPGPLPHVEQTPQRIIRQNGSNIKRNDTQQTMVHTYINSKQATAHGIFSEVVPVYTHPLHEWILPADNPQCTPPSNTIIPTEQTVDDIPGKQRVADILGKQRVPPGFYLQCITNAPPIMATPNPTKKRTLKNTKWTHLRLTHNNIPGSIPTITRVILTHPFSTAPQQWSLRLAPPSTANPRQAPRVCLISVPQGLRQSNIISQEAINFFTDCVWVKSPAIYTLDRLKPKKQGLNFEQVAMPMVHPTTGKTISSYKMLMHDPATSKIWQMAFSKDFGGMAQGDNKTGQKGSNSMFVMTQD
jgi:hypothetical protein